MFKDSNMFIKLTDIKCTTSVKKISFQRSQCQYIIVISLRVGLFCGRWTQTRFNKTTFFTAVGIMV